MNTRQATRPATRSGCAETSRRAPPEFSYHSLSFDGVDQYVDCGTGLGDALGDNYAGSLTVSLWFKADVTSGNDGLFNIGTFASHQGEFQISLQSNILYFTLNNNGWVRGAAFTDTASWHHVACVYATGSEANTKMYLDGSAVGTGGASFPSGSDMDFAGLKTIIGGYYNTSYTFNGDIDEVSVWNAALDADAVTAVYNSGAPNNLNQDNGDYTNSGDLQGWWRMGEGNDPGYYIISDASGNGNDGTTQNEPAWSNDTPQRWPQNFSYYGLEFNGVDQYVNVGNSASIQDLANFSMSFWFKADTVSNYHTIYSDATTGYKGKEVRIDSNDKLEFFTYNMGTDESAVSTTTIVANTWYHVVVTHSSAGKNEIFINGALEHDDTTAGSYVKSETNGYFGRYDISGTDGGYWDGEIDEASIWDVVLDADAVAAIYNGGVPAALTSLSPTAWYRMGEGNTVDGALVTDLAATDSNALYLPGVASNYASVPDAADLDGFTNFTLEAKGVTFADWTTPSTSQGLMSKYKTSPAQRSWLFRVNTDGKLFLVLSFDATATTTYTSSEATGVTDGATADLMVMRTGEDIRFYVDGVQLGTDVTCVTTALHNSTDVVAIGAASNTTGNPMTGSMERVRIWNSAVANQATPTETPVLDANFTLADKGVTSFTATSGQTVTVNTTSIADPAVIRQATDGVNVNSPAWTKNTPS